jgi:lipopolysaccharide heptosyltransferase II
MLKRKRTPLDKLEPRCICIIKPSALGDIVHALPVLTGLRRRFPEASISWVINRSYEPLLQGHPDLTETLPFDRGALRHGWWASLRTYSTFFGTLRRSRFDLVLDLQGLFRSGLMVWATCADRRVGLRGAREGANWFCTDVVEGPEWRERHAVDRYWSAAAALGANEADRVFRLPPFEQEQQWASQTLAAFPRPWIAAGVGSRWQTKRWLPAHYAVLLQRAQGVFGGTIIFVGGPEDVSASMEAARTLARERLLLAGRTTLPQLAAVLGRVDVMVANDTGPLHLARALGQPVVAPYTCTKVALTGPYGQQQGAVETTVHCGGSLIKRCPRMECMDELTPDRLWPTLHEVLHRWEQTSRVA